MAEVADDGVGGARADAGSGLDGLAGRIEALGGTLEVASPAGAGTRLRAAIPLWPWRSPRDPSLEFGYDGDGGEGEELIRQILAGRKTATLSLAREWDLEGGPPRPGQLLPVLDHLGTRHATVEVVSASVMAFGDVDEDVLADDSAEARSPDAWRASQRSFYEACREETAILLGEPDWRITDGEPIVITYFRLVAER